MELVDNVIQMSLGCKSHVLVVNLAHMRSNPFQGVPNSLLGLIKWRCSARFGALTQNLIVEYLSKPKCIFQAEMLIDCCSLIRMINYTDS